LLTRGIIPLYHQVRESLTDRIGSGAWCPGQLLPSEGDLALEFGVSKITIRQAMQLLQNQGLVERVQGRGTFVSRPKVLHNLMELSTRSSLGPEHITQNRLQYIKEVLPSRSVAHRLQLKPGETVFELKRSVLEGNDPLMLITSWLPAKAFPGLDQLDRETIRKSLRRLLNERYGVEVTHQHKEIEVAVLDDDEAEALNSQPGAPALLLTYLSHDAMQMPVEYRKWIVRADRCKCVLDLDTPEHLV
jgi:GntR family transcriptional regulator